MRVDRISPLHTAYLIHAGCRMYQVPAANVWYWNAPEDQRFTHGMPEIFQTKEECVGDALEYFDFQWAIECDLVPQLRVADPVLYDSLLSTEEHPN